MTVGRNLFNVVGRKFREIKRLVGMSIEQIFLRSISAAPSLRVALLFSSQNLPRPSKMLVEELLKCDYVNVVAAIYSAPAASDDSPDEPALYRLYRSLDATSSGIAAHALAPEDCRDLLDKFPAYTLDDTRPSPTPASARESLLAALEIDVILALNPIADPSALAKISRYGVWLNRWGDPLLGDRRTEIFWSTIRGSDTFAVWLEAYVAGQLLPLTLAAGTTSLASRFSTQRNLGGSVQVGIGLVLSSLWQLHSSGWDRVRAANPNGTIAHPAADTFPSNWQLLSRMFQKSLTQVRHRLRLQNTQEIWRTGFRLESRQEGLPTADAMRDMTWVDAPRGHYYADPFAIRYSGKSYLFVEDFDIDRKKGVISCLEIDPNGAPGRAQVVLERPYHLSYPQVFAYEGEIYMIPESGLNGTVELYRATDFPTTWELVRVLYRGLAFDTTVLRHAGRFWFFVTLADVAYTQRSALLVLFHAETLLGNWTLHPASPISRDLRYARGGGSFFKDGESWIRPAQDCSVSYGGSLNYQRIVEIDTQHYREEPANTLTPNFIPGASGMHTYNRNGHLELIDIKIRVRNTAAEKKGGHISQ
jgi:hypothetical protein